MNNVRRTEQICHLFVFTMFTSNECCYLINYLKIHEHVTAQIYIMFHESEMKESTSCLTSGWPELLNIDRSTFTINKFWLFVL